jgi:hypothetical protein
MAVNYGAPRYRPEAGQRADPGAVVRFPSSRRGFDSRHPLQNKSPGHRLFSVVLGFCHG